MLSIAHAVQVNPDRGIAVWNNHTEQEKIQYAQKTTLLCKSVVCAPYSIKRCMDEVSRPPIPAAMRNETIGSISVNCIVMLNK